MDRYEISLLAQDLSDAYNDLEQMEKKPHLFEVELRKVKARINRIEGIFAQQELLESASYDLNGNER